MFDAPITSPRPRFSSTMTMTWAGARVVRVRPGGGLLVVWAWPLDPQPASSITATSPDPAEYLMAASNLVQPVQAQLKCLSLERWSVPVAPAAEAPEP